MYKFLTEKEVDLSNFRLENYKKEFAIYVPQYLLPADSVYAKAALQYSDYAHEVFLVAVHEQKKELLDQGLQPTIEEYADYVKVAVQIALTNAEITSKKTSVINGMPAITLELDGDFGQQHVYYIFTVYETGSDFYQIISWTTTVIKPEVKKDIYTSIQSFAMLQ